METQTCGHCREVKPLNEFAPSFRGRPGTWCRSCMRAGRKPRPATERQTKAEPRTPARHGNVPPVDVPAFHAYCWTCEQAKPTGEFYLKKNGQPRQPCKACYRDWHRGRYQPKDGATDEPRTCAHCGRTYQPKQRRPSLYCSRECLSAAREASGRLRASHLRTRFGITPEDYERMLAAQGGGCAICGNGANKNSPSRAWLHVDHDHATGRVRGILCDRCNQSIGQFGDDPVLLRRAADYLEAGRS